MKTDYIDIEDLSDDIAKDELTRLANLLDEANLAYHGGDSPIMTDAEIDFLKKRNLEIELKFPQYKKPNSPTEKIGSLPSEIFSKSRSLTGVLEPFSDSGNIEMFKRAGFKDIEYIFTNICFKGWICIK